MTVRVVTSEVEEIAKARNYFIFSMMFEIFIGAFVILFWSAIRMTQRPENYPPGKIKNIFPAG